MTAVVVEATEAACSNSRIWTRISIKNTRKRSAYSIKSISMS